MFPIKICGISNRESLEIVLKYPVSSVGFIFYSNSPRFINQSKIKEISHLIPNTVSTVGVFVNESIDVINSISEKLNLDFIQLHGDETPDFCSEISKPVIKAFRIRSNFNFKKLEKFDVFAYLLDTYQYGIFGGTGESFNWDLIKNLEINTPIILSGGINPIIIENAIKTINPSAIDVNSGVESCPGYKDENKIKNLFLKIKLINNKNNIFRKNSY